LISNFKHQLFELNFLKFGDFVWFLLSIYIVMKVFVFFFFIEVLDKYVLFIVIIESTRMSVESTRMRVESTRSMAQ
jgi:hypothetical protein